MPETEDWLRDEERARFASLKTPKRRADWLLGRWTAKQLVCSVLCLPLEPHDVAVMSARDGWPQVSVGGCPRFSLSISHSHGRAFCALAESGMLGADIERVEPRLPQFTEDYFTEDELKIVRRAGNPDVLITAIWSAKESVLKALRLGLTVDTRAVSCLIDLALTPGWKPFVVECDAGRLTRCPQLRGWWRVANVEGTPYVLTLVGEGQGHRSGAGIDDQRYGVLHRGTGTAQVYR